MAVTVPLSSGLLISVEPSLVTCIEEVDPTTCRLFWADSSPGQSDSYVTVALPYSGLVTALGPPADWQSILVAPYAFGGLVGFARSRITAIEATPGDIACRVFVGSDRTSGYIVVPGDFVTVTATLAPPPPVQPPPPFLSATCRVNLTAPSVVFTQAAAVYAQTSINSPVVAQVVFDSAAPSTFQAQLRELATPTVAVAWQESSPVTGERVALPTFFGGLTAGTWYVLEAQETGGVQGQILGCYVQG